MQVFHFTCQPQLHQHRPPSITSNRRSVTSTWTPCICNYGLCIFKYLINGLCIFKYLKQRQEKIRLAAGDVISQLSKVTQFHGKCGKVRRGEIDRACNQIVKTKLMRCTQLSHSQSMGILLRNKKNHPCYENLIIFVAFVIYYRWISVQMRTAPFPVIDERPKISIETRKRNLKFFSPVSREKSKTGNSFPQFREEKEKSKRIFSTFER